MFRFLLVTFVNNSRKMSRKSEIKCILKNVKNDGGPELPNIEILNSEKMEIGRSIITKIENPSVSRKQLHAKADFKNKVVLISLQSGSKSPSAINGFVLVHGEGYEAKHGDLIEVLYNTVSYELLFIEECPTKKTTEDSWEVIDENGLYVYTTKDLSSSTRIAAYDLDGTLIRTVSGNVFPKHIDDWQLNYGSITTKLKHLHENGFKIVIFTNQAGVSLGKTDINDFKKKLQTIISRLSVPVQAFVAVKHGKYRKPKTGMWDVLTEYKNDGVEIDLTSSFFVGDAAGRPEQKTPVKRRKDHSLADRLFAINVGLNFHTPEEHFLNEKKVKWIEPEFDPRKLDKNVSVLMPPSTKLKGDSLEIILLVGCQGSGKSNFSNTFMKKLNYAIINRDQLFSWQKCFTNITEAIEAKKSCVVDNTNPDVASRKKFIDLAKKLKVPIRCFVMNTTFKHCKHNIAFRDLTDPSHSKISEVVLNTFKSKYEEPTMNEGYTEIVRVNFVPKFEDPKHEKLYNLHLLEK